jgi:hypothetical protein
MSQIFIFNFFFVADDVVAYEHGDNSARTLSSAGFQNLMFRSYNGYSIDFFFIYTKSKGDNICV